MASVLKASQLCIYCMYLTFLAQKADINNRVCTSRSDLDAEILAVAPHGKSYSESCTSCEKRAYKATPDEPPSLQRSCNLSQVYEPVLDLRHHGSIVRAAILQATAEISAAPRPLPSSDWMKVMSQSGVNSHTTLWNRSLNLKQEVNESVACIDWFCMYVRFRSAVTFYSKVSHWG